MTYFTKLNDRILFGDGDSVLPLSELYEYILQLGSMPSGVFLSKQEALSEEVKKYNKLHLSEKLTFKKDVREPDTSWDIPEEFKTIDLPKYILGKLKKEIDENQFSDDEIKKRYYRMKLELRIWNDRGLDDMLRTLIYIVNTFEDNGVIWGAGRGSSCASYILYLIGLHQVDSVQYDLDIGDFFR